MACLPWYVKGKSYFPISVILEKKTLLLAVNNNLISNVNSLTPFRAYTFAKCVVILTPVTHSKVFSMVFKLQRCLITISYGQQRCVHILTIFRRSKLHRSKISLDFLGGKERIRISISSAYSSFEAFKCHNIEHASLKAKAEKWRWKVTMITRWNDLSKACCL